jgi:xanthine dehydrogenase accessory factor
MKELNAILEAWRAAPQTPGVLATVVHVEGSAYRRPGARMYISADGCRRIGTISGGCLEGDVARKAAWWTSAGDPVIRVYDTSSEEDAVWEFGLGCQGVIHVLLERVESPRTQELLRQLDDGHKARREQVIGTVIRSAQNSALRVGDHLYVFRGALAAAAQQTLSERRSRLVHTPDADIFVEYVPPRQRLLILGAGHDAVPVASLAALLGWEVTVADVRGGYVKPERFPGASRTVQLASNGDLSGLSIDRETAVILMTHNLPLDTKLLPQLRKIGPRYLGCLGPRKRLARIASAAAGGDEILKMEIHSPAGLDLGGDSPEAIALSIVSEIQAFLHQRRAESLRWHLGPIHEPAQVTGSVAEDLRLPVEAVSAQCEILAHG